MPHLTFFCELDAQPLTELFADGRVIAALRELGVPSAVSLALRDLSDARAAVVRQLNAAQIPVIAWLLLPQEQGYWFNADNAPQAADTYQAFKMWTAQHSLKWDGVGLDIEPDHAAMTALMAQGAAYLPTLFRAMRSTETVHLAQAAYQRLGQQIRKDGWRVDAYHLPLMADERRAGSLLLQRLLGVVDFNADRDILMLYSSFMGAHEAGVLWAYADEGAAIAVGSTGGGVEIGDLPSRVLSWEQLCRDLRYAHAHTDAIHIFSLEGCVKLDYLTRLKNFAWNSPFVVDDAAVRRVTWMRRGLYAALWAAAHPGLMAIGVWLLVEQIVRWSLRRQRRN